MSKGGNLGSGLLKALLDAEQKGGGRSGGRSGRSSGGNRSVTDAKRAAWINEVRAVMAETGMSWKDSLKEASLRRKQRVKVNATVNTTVNATVNAKVNAKVNGGPSKTIRPSQSVQSSSNAAHPHTQSTYRHLSVPATIKLLRDHYQSRAGQFKDESMGLMPVRTITVTRKDGKTYQRRAHQK